MSQPLYMLMEWRGNIHESGKFPMSMRISLEEFLRTGCLGQLQPGLTQQQVMDLLGPPEDVGGNWKGKPTIWKYGDVEIFFTPKSQIWFKPYADLNIIHGQTKKLKKDIQRLLDSIEGTPDTSEQQAKVVACLSEVHQHLIGAMVGIRRAQRILDETATWIVVGFQMENWRNKVTFDFPKCFDMKDWELKPWMRLPDIEKLLQEKQIPFRYYEETFGGSTHPRLAMESSEVKFLFEGDDDRIWNLSR